MGPLILCLPGSRFKSRLAWTLQSKGGARGSGGAEEGCCLQLCTQCGSVGAGMPRGPSRQFRLPHWKVVLTITPRLWHQRASEAFSSLISFSWAPLQSWPWLGGRGGGGASVPLRPLAAGAYVSGTESSTAS